MSLNIEALEQSFEQIKPQATEFASSFYRTLLADYPQLQPLFANTNMEEQEQKLVQTLATVILNLRYPETLAGPMRDLGERHARYGTIQQHYPMVADALLKTFKDYLGDSWTDEVRQAWIDAYQMIVDLMLEGAKQAETSTMKPLQPVQPSVVSRDDRPMPPASQPLPHSTQPTSADRYPPPPVVKPSSQPPSPTPPKKPTDGRAPKPQTEPISQQLSRPVTRGEVLLLFTLGTALLLVLGFFLLRSNTSEDNPSNPSDRTERLQRTV